MKYAALTCLLLTSIMTPAMAMQGKDCAAKSEKVRPGAREAFMQSCLAQAETPANVKEEERKHKNAVCEQNAKNKQLRGNEKANYHANCMNKNEAAIAAKEPPKNVITPNFGTEAPSKPHRSSRKAVPAKQKEHKKARKKTEKKSAAKSSGLFGML